MFVEGLFSLLANDPNVSALLGTSRADNTLGIFPTEAPDEVNVPYIVYEQTARIPILSFGGVNKLQELHVTLSCYGTPYKSAKALAQAVKNALDGFTGKLNDGSIVGNTIPDSEHDEAEPMQKGTIYGVILGYTFMTTDMNDFNTAVIATDPLNEANANPIGPPWVADAGGVFPPLQILGGMCRPSTVNPALQGSLGLYEGVTLPADQYVQVTLSSFSRNGASFSLLLRASVLNGLSGVYIDVYFQPGATPGSDFVQVGAFKGSSLVPVASYNGPTNLTFNVGDVFLVKVMGNQILVYQNGILIFQVADSNVTLPGPTGMYLTAIPTGSVNDMGITNFVTGGL